MKKTIALLLASLMVFALCACGGSGGSKELTQAERDQIFLEEGKKRGLDLSAFVAYQAPEKEEEKDEYQPEFAVEDCEVILEGSLSKLRAKVRNLSDTDVDGVFVSFQLLDKNGDAIGYANSNRVTFEKLFAGQAAWESVYVHTDDVETIKFYWFVLPHGTAEGELQGTLEYKLEDVIKSK